MFYNSTTCGKSVLGSSSIVTLNAIQHEGVYLAHTCWDKEPLYNATLECLPTVVFFPICALLNGSTRAALLETAAAFLRWNVAFHVPRKPCGCCAVEEDKQAEATPPAAISGLQAWGELRVAPE